MKAKNPYMTKERHLKAESHSGIAVENVKCKLCKTVYNSTNPDDFERIKQIITCKACNTSLRKLKKQNNTRKHIVKTTKNETQSNCIHFDSCYKRLKTTRTALFKTKIRSKNIFWTLGLRESPEKNFRLVISKKKIKQL